MATVISLLSNLCNSPFDQQHSHHHHHSPQLLFPPYGQGPETLQQRYSGTGAGGRNRSNEATHHHQQHQLDALDFHLLSRTLEEEFEQMEYSGSSGPYQYQQQQHDQQQHQQQPARRQGQQDFEQISPGYNLDNEDTYSGSPNNFQDYQNNFVDSPPDSKEPWPIDYNKMHTTIASSSGANDTTNASTTVTAVAVATAAGTVAPVTSQQQQQQQQDNGGMYMNNAILPSRKRRMEWMSPQEEDTDGTETKIANIDKERDARRKAFFTRGKSSIAVEDITVPSVTEMCETYGFGGDTMDKDYVRKRLKCFNSTSNGNDGNNLDTNITCNSTSNNNELGSMRWADDLDLDLSNELSSNGYISDSLLNFPVFKQELPSPPQKPPQPQQQQHSQSAHQQQQHQLHQQQQQQSLHQQASSSQDHSAQHHAPSSLQQSLGPTNSGNAANSHQQQQVVQYHQQQQGQSSMNGAGQSLMNATDHHGTPIGAGLSNLPSFLQSNRLENDPTGGGGILQMQQDGALPVARGDKTHDDHNRFQYVLAAATSIATKNNEESLTYLNQGQSYEIKLKKLGDLSPFRGKILKSIIKICFHERRLQYMEREQMQLWQASRPGERILDVDIPLSYGLMQIQPTRSNLLNTIEVFWDPMKEVGVYVKVNCISTEFTPKKHGGEKGVPFRIQVETYIDTNGLHNGTGNGVAGGVGGVDDKDGIRPLHAAACQIKVFKLKGADRKHKQDREKILKRPVAEQEKYQRSCDCTILTDITTDSVITPLGGNFSPDHIKRNVSPLLTGPTSPGQLNKFENIMSSVLCNGGNVVSPGANPTTTTSTSAAAAMVVVAAAAAAAGVQSNPIGISNVSSTNGLCKASPLGDQPIGGVLSPQQPSELDDYVPTITKETSPGTLAQWLAVHRLSAYAKTFAQFSGSDLLRMSKEDLCKICGLADGIRMFNILHSKAITPRLTIYVSFQTNIYHAIYLHSNTIPELVQNLSKIPGFLEAINALNTPNSTTSEAGLWSGSFGVRAASGSGKLPGNNGTNTGVPISVPSPSSPISSSSGIAKLQLLIKGPNGIQVLLTEDVLHNIKDETLFQLELKPNGNILMKAVHSVTGTAADCSIDDDVN
uniref:Grh/CP2 DB domain-containing protein n=1 Tax=Anopheles minimus TaxID=112268 RepID=A0A182WL00_9DIPT